MGSKKYVCCDFEGCKPGYPVKVCTFDGPHTPSSVDDGTTVGEDGLKAFIPRSPGSSCRSSRLAFLADEAAASVSQRWTSLGSGGL